MGTSSFAAWLLKSRMSFYNDADLILPWYFGLLCWNYAVAGGILLWLEPQWARQPQVLLGGRRFPYRSVALLLILVQAPLSFQADYRNMTKDSYWHVADRCLAVPLVVVELLRVAVMAYHRGKQPKLLLSMVLSLVFAGASFACSQKAQAILDHSGFIFWHNCWHLYPLLGSAIALYDFYFCGGWKQATRQYLYRAELHILKRVE